MHTRNLFGSPARLAALGLAAVATMAFVTACGDDDSSSSANTEPVVVTQSGSVSLAVGQQMVVEVDANPTTGFQWEVESNSDESVVKLENDEYTAPTGDAVGAGGQEKLTFDALAEGTSEVVLVYHQPFEPDVEPAETVTLDVTVG